MGRKGSGVEVRGNSIRVQFTFNGKVLRRTLNLDGKPLPPTAANLKYAHRLAGEIRERIRFGSFSLAEYFPADGDVGQPLCSFAPERPRSMVDGIGTISHWRFAATPQ